MRVAVAILCVCGGASLWAQSARPTSGAPAVIGTVDGKPLYRLHADRDQAEAMFRQQHRHPPGPADEKAVQQDLERIQCAELNAQLQAYLTAKLERQFSIHVGDAEAEALVRSQVGKLEPQAESAAQQDGKAKMNRDAAHAALVRAFRPLIQKQRLDAAIDQKIAATDPQFKTYLDEETRATTWRNPVQKTVSGTIPAHAAYLRTKRDEWWKVRRAELKVQVDGALARQCGVVPAH